MRIIDLLKRLLAGPSQKEHPREIAILRQHQEKQKQRLQEAGYDVTDEELEERKRLAELYLEELRRQDIVARRRRS